MHEVVGGIPSNRRVRVERGIYRPANGKYVVCFMLDGKPRFRTVGDDLELARAQRLRSCGPRGSGSMRPRRGCDWRWFAGWWLERYERRVSTGEPRVRTLEIHTYYLKRHVLPLGGVAPDP